MSPSPDPSSPGSPPEPPDPAWVEAWIAEGVALAQDGHLPEAEQVLRKALGATRGLGTRHEARAACNLGTVYGIQGRAFEALLLYRRGLRLAEAHGDLRGSVLLLANMGGIYAQLDLHEKLPEIVRRMEEMIAPLTGEAREEMERFTLWQRFECAAWEGDGPVARRVLEQIRATFAQDPDPRVPVTIHELSAHLHRLAGEHGEALACVEQALAAARGATASELGLLCRKLECLESLGRVAEARDVALHAIERLEGTRSDSGLAEERIHVGSMLASCLERHGGDPDSIRRAYDLAAAATLQRIRQVDECLQLLPGLTAAPASDRDWLGSLRAAYCNRSEQLVARVGRLLEEARKAGRSPLYVEHPDDDLVRICAWCGFVLTRSGHWVPVGQYVPDHPSVRVTHGICPECFDDVRALPSAAR